MATKQHLRQIKQLDSMIDAKYEQIERLRTIATRVTTEYKHTKQKGGSKRYDKMADVVCKIVDMEKEINHRIDNLIDLKSSVQKQIDVIQNTDYQLLLTLRYLNYKNWEDIASTMGFTERWIYIMHGRALIEFQKNSL